MHNAYESLYRTLQTHKERSKVKLAGQKDKLLTCTELKQGEEVTAMLAALWLQYEQRCSLLNMLQNANMLTVTSYDAVFAILHIPMRLILLQLLLSLLSCSVANEAKNCDFLGLNNQDLPHNVHIKSPG